MIRVTISKSENRIQEVTCINHAGFAKRGKDIVCSAVSILMINTINSIEQFSDCDFTLIENEKDALIHLKVNTFDDESQLLLKSLELGLTQIEKEYEKYLKVDYKEA